MTSIGPGTALAGYRIGHTIGEGGMAIVHLAERLSDGRQVVLKVLREELADDEPTRRRFLHESSYARVLDHPNVVRILDAGEHEGRLYIVMQYVEGADLSTLLEDGPLAPHAAIAILAQVADALDAAHDAGLLHRDVKPGNVLVADGDPRRSFLTDFGLSRQISRKGTALTAAGMFVGTLAYIAPEQMLGDNPGAAADVYSLGCVLFECLTGSPPFTGPALNVMQSHIESAPPKLAKRGSGFPRALDAAIAKALAKEPGQRHATCRELIDAAADALGVAAPPASERPHPPTELQASAPAPPAPAPPVLLVRSGGAEGLTIELHEDFLIGRAQPAPGRLGADPELSRRHALVRRAADDSLTIEDLGSSNGTYVNGERIEHPVAIGAGDEIAVGGSLLVVAAATGAAAQPVRGAPPAGRSAVVTGLSLRVTFAPLAGLATLQLDDASEPIALHYRAGSWGLAEAS